MKLNFWTKKQHKPEARALTTIPSPAWALFGTRCSDYGAMNVSAFFAALNLISNSVAMLPVKVLSRTASGSNELDNHPIMDVFGRHDNGELISRYTFLKCVVESVVLRGSAFAHISRDRDGNVTGVRYLTHDDVQVYYDPRKQVLYYSITSMGLNKVEPCNMLHFIMHTRDGVNGISLLSYAARSLATANNSEDSASDFFSNGLNVSGFLKSTTPISDKQKQDVVAAWQSAYGAGGTGVAVLNCNLDYTALSLKPSDAQLLESRAFNVADIARFFNLNPMLIGGSAGVTYSSVEQLQNYFLTFTLQPWIAMIEAELNRKLLKPSERMLEVVLETGEILRVDKSSQANYYRAMIDSGILSRNEVRKELGYNPFDGGDAHTIAYSDAEQNTIDNDNQDNITE